MAEESQIKLTAPEITELWTAYMNDTALICQVQFFLAKVEDNDIKPILQHSLEIAQTHVTKLTEIFNKENYPVPYGFRMEDDVDINAPRLFSDTYFLYYLQETEKVALNGYTVSLCSAIREDIHSFFNECIREVSELLKMVNDALLSKGLFIRPPYLPKPDSYNFVKNQSFLTGYLGKRRPLVGTEIANLFANFQRSVLGACTLIGFSQVAKNKEVRRFLVRGKEIAKKHSEVFGSILHEDDILSPSSWATEVTDSTTYTFSDKLMMFYTTSLIALSVGYYGASISTSLRKDLGVKYGRLMTEILKYAEDGTKIMIKYGWMEEPPHALDRDKLTKKK